VHGLDHATDPDNFSYKVDERSKLPTIGRVAGATAHLHTTGYEAMHTGDDESSSSNHADGVMSANEDVVVAVAGDTKNKTQSAHGRSGDGVGIQQVSSNYDGQEQLLAVRFHGDVVNEAMSLADSSTQRDE
jgi:hypothetical protein